MTATSVQRFYRYHALIYDSTRWAILHGRRRAARELGLHPDSRVLEIGCGTGLNFRFAQEWLDPRRGGIVGVDFSDDMLRRAERRVAAQGWSNVELIHADATRLDLGRTFDAVFFAYSLTMIPDWPAAIERAVRHLRVGGRLVVLDFGRFQGWGPLGPLMRAWLRANHVETLRPYVEELRRAFPDLRVLDWLGGYCFTAVGQRKS
ncbi:MAG: methyltransferase domain-containing protein [Phycisphaerae bacterium]